MRIISVRDPLCSKKLFDLVVNSAGKIIKILVGCRGFTVDENGEKKKCGVVELTVEDIKKQLTEQGIHIK